jgi:hypothetical protein
MDELATRFASTLLQALHWKPPGCGALNSVSALHAMHDVGASCVTSAPAAKLQAWRTNEFEAASQVRFCDAPAKPGCLQVNV